MKTDKRPNIIFINTDQQRADTVKGTGAGWMKTPNLDSLVNEGVSFTNAFCTAATCVSSRASFYTGLYPHNTGLYEFGRYTGEMNWVNRMAEAGYYCQSIGKTHIGEGNHGFHNRIGEQLNKCNPYFETDSGLEKSLWHRELEEAGFKPPLNLHHEETDFYNNLGAVEWSLPEEFHPDIWVGNKAVEWIENTSVDSPFYLHIGFMGPHDLYDPVARYLELYDDAEIPVPDFTGESDTDIPEELFASKNENEILDDICSIRSSLATYERVRRMRKHYYANISMIDDMIGKIFSALKKKGLWEDSIIIFTSDHGDNLFDHGLFYKGEMYDSVLKVPLIVKTPTLTESGRTVTGLVSLLDLARFILDKSGVESGGVEGISLLPTIEKGEKHPREYVYAEEGCSILRREPDMLAMIRSEDCKFVYFSGTQNGQLFDLRNDPEEKINLWNNKNYSSQKEEMRAKLLDWLYSSLFKNRNIFSEAR